MTGRIRYLKRIVFMSGFHASFLSEIMGHCKSLLSFVFNFLFLLNQTTLQYDDRARLYWLVAEFMGTMNMYI